LIDPLTTLCFQLGEFYFMKFYLYKMFFFKYIKLFLYVRDL